MLAHLPPKALARNASTSLWNASKSANISAFAPLSTSVLFIDVACSSAARRRDETESLLSVPKLWPLDLRELSPVSFEPSYDVRLLSPLRGGGGGGAAPAIAGESRRATEMELDEGVRPIGGFDGFEECRVGGGGGLILGLLDISSLSDTVFVAESSLGDESIDSVTLSVRADSCSIGRGAGARGGGGGFGAVFG